MTIVAKASAFALAALGLAAAAAAQSPPTKPGQGLAVGQAVAQSPGRAAIAGVWLLEEGQNGAFAASPPLNAAARALHERRTSGVDPDPTLACMPMGYPRNMLTRLPIQIVVNDRQALVVYPTGLRTRRIFLDGRQHDPEADPSYNGEAIGRWEGDVLVSQSYNFKDTWFDHTGVPHGPRLEVTERIRALDGGARLEIEMTAVDPDVFTAPWRTVKTYRAQPGRLILDFSCQENVRANPKWAHTAEGPLYDLK